MRPNQVTVSMPDLDARILALAENGFSFESGPKGKNWRWREAELFDPDGNRVILYFAGVNRVNPPWRITPP